MQMHGAPGAVVGHVLTLSQQVLLEKGVEEGKIFFLTLIAAPEGLTNICRRYPKVSKCPQPDHLRTPLPPSY